MIQIHKRLRVAVAGLAAASMLLAACDSGSSKNADDGTGPIKIGFIGGASGVFAPYEQPALEGAKLAVDEINKAGGIDGRKLELVVEDNKSDINESARAGSSIVESGAVASLVPVDINYGGGAAQVLQAAGLPAISVGGGGVQWAKFGPLVYNVGTTADSDGAAMAKYAIESGWKDAYLLIDTISDFSQQLCTSFEKEFKALGGTVLGKDTFNNKDTSLSAQITRMKAVSANPGVVANCSFPPGGSLVVKQLRDAGIDSPLISSNGMDGDFWFKKTMPDLSNVYTANWASVWGDDPSPAVNDLVAKLKAKAGEQPQNQFGVSGYMALRALAQAIEKAGSTKGEDIAKVMNSYSQEDVGIPLTFTKDFHMDTTREYRIVEVQDGKPHYVQSIKAD